MKIAIVDHGSGNLRSAAKAFERAAREADIVATVDVTNQASAIDAADRVVLPGVGAFRDCVDGLKALPEAAAAVETAALRRAAPQLVVTQPSVSWRARSSGSSWRSTHSARSNAPTQESEQPRPTIGLV